MQYKFAPTPLISIKSLIASHVSEITRVNTADGDRGMSEVIVRSELERCCPNSPIHEMKMHRGTPIHIFELLTVYLDSAAKLYTGAVSVKLSITKRFFLSFHRLRRVLFAYVSPPARTSPPILTLHDSIPTAPPQPRVALHAVDLTKTPVLTQQLRK